MSKLLVNIGETVMAPDAQFHLAAFEGAFSPKWYYSEYVSNTTTTAKTRSVTFDRAGTLQGLAFKLHLAWSHFENDDDIAELEIQLQEYDGSDWVTRTSATLRNDQIVLPNSGRNFRDWVRVEFDPHYSIDTDPDKWRFWFGVTRISGSDARYFYLGKASSDPYDSAGDIVPYLEETDAFDYGDGDTGDVLFNFGRLIISEPATFDGLDISDRGWYGIGVYESRVLFYNGTSYLGEEHPKIIVEETAGQVRLGGIIGISGSGFKEESSFYLVQDGDNLDKPARQKVELVGIHHDADFHSLFYTYVTGRGYTPYRGITILSEFDDTWKAELAQPAYKDDTEIRIKGDYTGVWQPGDSIYITTPVYASTYSYADYSRHEGLTIDSLSYDSDADETVVTLTSALTRYYDWDIYNNFSNATSNANIDPSEWARYVINAVRDGARAVIRAEAETGLHTNRMNMYLYDVVVTFDGVRIEDLYMMRFDYMYSIRSTPNAISNTRYDNVVARFCSYSTYFRYVKGLTFNNYYQLLGFEGTTAYKPTRALTFEYSSGITVNNLQIFGAGYIYFPYGVDITVNDVWFEGDYLVLLSAGTQNYVINNVTIPTCRKIVSINNGGGNLDVHNVKLAFAMYHSSYNETTANYGGLAYIGTGYTMSGKLNFYDVQVGTIHDVVYIQSDSQVDVYVKNLFATGTVYRRITTVNNYYLQQAPGSILAYENYQGTGDYEAWITEGYIHAVDDGAGGLDWEMNPYDASFTMIKTQNSLVTEPGQPVVVVAFVKIEDEDFYAQPHQLPRLEISGLGISEPTAIAYAQSTTDWQPIVATGTPTATGFFDIKLTFQTDSPNSKVLLRYVKVYPPQPRDTSMLNLTDRAMPMPTIITELNSTYDIWGAPSSNDYGAGTLAELIKAAAAQLDNPDQFKADVSGLASQATADAIKERTDRLPDTPADEASVQAVKAKTDALPADPASTTDVQAVAADVWGQVAEGTLSHAEAVRIMLAVLAGPVDGAGTDIEQFYSQDGQTVRVRSHVDEDGNRSQVEVDGS